MLIDFQRLETVSKRHDRKMDCADAQEIKKNIDNQQFFIL